MTDLLELRDKLDASFGAGPAHRPVEDHLIAGRRAVRNRRLTYLAGGLAIAAVVSVGYAARPQVGPTARDAGVTAGSAGPSARDAGWGADELVRYSDDGELEVRPDAEIVAQRENPLGRTAPDRSDALSVLYRDDVTFVLIDTKTGVSSDPSGKALEFDEWVASTVALLRGDPFPAIVRFDDAGRLVPVGDAVILDQRVGVDLGPGFAPPGSTTAVARVRTDGKVWFVAARDLDGPPEYIPAAASVVGPTMEDFIAHARKKYASGAGLR